MVSRSLTIKSVFQVLAVAGAGIGCLLTLGCNNPCGAPTAGTVCTTACQTLSGCMTCCAMKHGSNSGPRETCEDACDAHGYQHAPDSSPPPCDTCPPYYCDFPEPNCDDEDGTTEAIFASVPSFMDTTALRDFVCRLTSAESDDLIDDFLLYQT